MAILAPVPVQDIQINASQLRRVLGNVGWVQRGVFGAGDYKVTMSGAGTLNVNVAGGSAAVPSASGFHYIQENNSTITALPGGAIGSAANPRIDSVVLKVEDRTVDGSAVSGASVFIRIGTPTALASLDNRNGAPSVLATGELLLADLLMPINGTGYLAGNIRDRRPWAHGLLTTVSGNGAGNQSTTSTSYGTVPAVTSPRIELVAGNALEISGTGAATTAAGGGGSLRILVGSTPTQVATLPAGANTNAVLPVSDLLTGLSGSMLVALQHAATVAGQNFTTNNASPYIPRFVLREIVGGAGDNS